MSVWRKVLGLVVFVVILVHVLIAADLLVHRIECGYWLPSAEDATSCSFPE